MKLHIYDYLLESSQEVEMTHVFTVHHPTNISGQLLRS